MKEPLFQGKNTFQTSMLNFGHFSLGIGQPSGLRAGTSGLPGLVLAQDGGRDPLLYLNLTHEHKHKPFVFCRSLFLSVYFRFFKCFLFFPRGQHVANAMTSTQKTTNRFAGDSKMKLWSPASRMGEKREKKGINTKSSRWNTSAERAGNKPTYHMPGVIREPEEHEPAKQLVLRLLARSPKVPRGNQVERRRNISGWKSESTRQPAQIQMQHSLFQPSRNQNPKWVHPPAQIKTRAVSKGQPLNQLAI